MHVNSKYKIQLALSCFLLTFLFCLTANAFELQRKITLSGIIFAEYCSDVCHPPATAEFEVQDNTGKIIYRGKTFNEKHGVYSVPGLAPGETYNLVITDTSFLQMTFIIDIPNSDKYPEISKDFLIVPKKAGAEMAFDVSPFKFKSTKLQEGYSTFNDRVLKILNENLDFNFEISCFPYSDDSKDSNMILTLERCRVLKEFFVSKGIKPERLSIKPNAETDPMNPPPDRIGPKGKRYNGSTYLVIREDNRH
jgi:hypothetical protein